MRRAIFTLTALVAMSPVFLFTGRAAQAIELLVIVNPNGSLTTTTNTGLVVDLTADNVSLDSLSSFYKGTIAEAINRTNDLNRAAAEQRSLAQSYPTGSFSQKMALSSANYFSIAAGLEMSVVSMLDVLPDVADIDEAFELIGNARAYQEQVRAYVQYGYNFSNKSSLAKKVLADLAPTSLPSKLEVRLDFTIELLSIHGYRFIIAIL